MDWKPKCTFQSPGLGLENLGTRDVTTPLGAKRVTKHGLVRRISHNKALPSYWAELTGSLKWLTYYEKLQSDNDTESHRKFLLHYYMQAHSWCIVILKMMSLIVHVVALFTLSNSKTIQKPFSAFHVMIIIIGAYIAQFQNWSLRCKFAAGKSSQSDRFIPSATEYSAHQISS